MVTTPKPLEAIWNCLSEIPDPDIPVISITELGLVRSVEMNDAGKVTVSLTPSYSGCPAMQLFKQEIVSALGRKGWNDVDVQLVYSPAWTSDWITNEAREKMRQHGITPPENTTSRKQALFSDHRPDCPWCRSVDTRKTSQFGSTPCKAIWFCNTCHQPFEYFKCI